MLSLRDPIHGFISAEPLEEALIGSRPVQRLRSIHQLGLMSLVFPGAEHSRFSHVLGAMHLAGRVYDHLASRGDGHLDPDPRCPERRRVRVAALLHDVGHAPFSHSAEDLFEDSIDHEEMTGRLLRGTDLSRIFGELGDGVTADGVDRILKRPRDQTDRLLSQIVTGELDVDKMDYLLRDSLYCGVTYGKFDLDRLLITMAPFQDPDTGDWGIGIEEGGVHVLESLVMARYYMFTQVYFNPTGKALELHLNEWLKEQGRRWPSDPERFLAEDDVSVTSAMRGSSSVHARAVVDRLYYPLAFQTREHLTAEEKTEFGRVIEEVRRQFPPHQVLVSNSAKDPHRLRTSPVLVERHDGALEPMQKASQFIRHLTRIDRYRIYAAPEIRDAVAGAVGALWDD